MELMLIEGDDEDSSDSLSCSMYHDMDMELHVDTLLGLVYGTHRYVHTCGHMGMDITCTC